ncbi:MAG: hypothetical protein BWY66_02028 [bacterium ADurb.Bin374]|nr:MAG: hypothetical protein BWY66_02028 [bacterium ADurb.Bin374]
MGGEQRRNGNLDRDLGRPHGSTASQARDGFLEQFDIQRESDRRDVAALLLAEHVAGAANLEIAHGDPEARSERRVLLDRGQPLCGFLRQPFSLRVEEERERLTARTADPAAQLVHLGEAQPLGFVDDQRVRVRDIEARLDDRRGEKHVELTLDEGEHRPLDLLFGHLAMRDADPCLGNEIA